MRLLLAWTATTIRWRRSRLGARLILQQVLEEGAEGVL